MKSASKNIQSDKKEKQKMQPKRKEKCNYRINKNNASNFPQYSTIKILILVKYFHLITLNKYNLNNFDKMTKVKIYQKH